jgi:hypothetical protein
MHSAKYIGLDVHKHFPKSVSRPGNEDAKHAAFPGEIRLSSQLRLIIKTVLPSIRSSSPVCRRRSSCFRAYSNKALQISLAGAW